MTEQDDMENWNYAHAASRGTIARRYPYSYEQGLGCEIENYEWDGIAHPGDGHRHHRGQVERAQSAQPLPPLGRVHGSRELGRARDLAPTRCRKLAVAAHRHLTINRPHANGARVSVVPDALCKMRTGRVRSLDHEIEPTQSALVDSGEPHQQSLVEEAVAAISRLVREIELGCQNRPPGALNLEMNVSCAAGVEARHDGGEPPAAIGVGELVAPQSETSIVVSASLVGLPELYKRARYWLAFDIQDEATDQNPFPGGYIGG